MGNSVKPKRFSINPIEFAVFSLITVIFLNSVHKLLFDWQDVNTLAIEEQVTQASPDGRTPAALSERSFSNLEIDCDTKRVERTSKSKIRLTGPLCGGKKLTQLQLVGTEVINTANQSKATVFTFDDSKRFSTDYIPLNRGENPIQMKFTYSGGRVTSRLLTIDRTK